MNPDLDTRLATARKRYVDRRPRSESLAAEAAEVFPGGHTRTVLHFDPFPFRVVRAAGARLVDVDGHTYVDLLGNYTAGFLGHSPSAIRAAVAGALDNGWSLGATHPTEIRFARLLADRFASIEQLRFTNSGTEANLMALAAALHHTGRRSILVFEGGYHGGVLTFGAERAVNVPHDFVVIPYNDVDALEAVFAEQGQTLAAALVEPMLGSGGCLPGSDAFLGRLRDLTATNGTVLIFDEVMTSRLSTGGLQELIDVQPDLTTLGKYLGGGMSFGAFGGRAEIMAAYDHRRPDALGHAGTFNNNVVTMAAGVATLTEVLTPERQAATNARGDHLRTELNTAFEASSAPFTVTGRGSLLALHPVVGEISSPGDLIGADDRWRELLFLDALEAGFYFARRGFIALSLEITDADVAAFVSFVQNWTEDLN